MSETKTATLKVKSFTEDYLKENGSSFILASGELVVETKGSGKDLSCKFKIGDGIHPYSLLKYTSSLYSLFPEFCICNNDYTRIVKFCIEDSE